MKSIDFDDFTSPFYSVAFVSIEKIYQILETVSSAIQTSSNFVKNTPLRVVFSTLFSVSGYPDETLSLVFDILQKRFSVFRLEPVLI